MNITKMTGHVAMVLQERGDCRIRFHDACFGSWWTYFEQPHSRAASGNILSVNIFSDVAAHETD
jgi:hypothetical protein